MEDYVRRNQIKIKPCQNKEADQIFLEYYWLKRIRRSRRLSYTAFYKDEAIAWIQCADPFGTKLTKSLQVFSINDAIELCRGYFIDETPSNVESCSIAMVLRLLPNDWYSRYGEIKKITIVYQDVDAGQKGIVYKALGFNNYGRCARARHYSKPATGNSRGHKIIWARALRPVSGMHYKVHLPQNNNMNMDD